MNRTIRLLFLMLFLGCIVPQVKAETSIEKQLELAARAAMNGQAESAMDIYSSLLNSGNQSADLYYNMGAASYQNEQLGKAILYTEKALILDPAHEKAQHNIQLLREEQVDGLAPISPFFLKAAANNISAWMSPNVWMITAILFGCLLAGVVWMWLLRPAATKRKRLQSLSVGLLLLCIVSVFFAFNREAKLTDNSRAILITEKADLYIAPGADADIEMEIHEGLNMKIIDDFEAWFKVELVDGRQGWVGKDAVSRI